MAICINNSSNEKGICWKRVAGSTRVNFVENPDGYDIIWVLQSASAQLWSEFIVGAVGLHGNEDTVADYDGMSKKFQPINLPGVDVEAGIEFDLSNGIIYYQTEFHGVARGNGIKACEYRSTNCWTVVPLLAGKRELIEADSEFVYYNLSNETKKARVDGSEYDMDQIDK
jgi:hypothetical protein